MYKCDRSVYSTRMKRLSILFVFALGCGGGSTTSSDDSPPPDVSEGGETTVTRDAFVIAPFQLSFEDGVVGMNSEGVVTLEGEEGGARFHPDGRIEVEGEGVVARLEGDALIADGEQVAEVTHEGIIRVDQYELSFAADGSVTGLPADAPPIRLEPADTPARRAAAVTLVMMIVLAPQPVEDSAPVEVEAVEPTTPEPEPAP